MYEPEDLNPFRTLEKDSTRVNWQARREVPRDAEVRDAIDFRDQEFLSGYLTDMGQLLPRRRTKLKKSTHRRLMRAVKLARCMALLPTTSKLPQFSRNKNPYTFRSRF
jgi:ribosomal protein S18